MYTDLFIQIKVGPALLAVFFFPIEKYAGTQLTKFTKLTHLTRLKMK